MARPRVHLAMEGLTAGYGGVPIIRDIFVQLGQGEVAAIVGPNGAGKSTLLKALVGVIPVMGGSIRLGDVDLTGLRTDQLARKGIAYVPQNRDVFETLTVIENLRMGGYQLGKDVVRQRIDEVLDAFPILKPLRERTANKLSGGERKLVACARAMMLRPSILVLDEPTSNLSADLADRLLHEQVTRIVTTGAGVLLVEQKAKAALEVADWAYLMVAGQIHLSAPAKQLLADASIGEMYLGKTPSGRAEPTS